MKNSIRLFTLSLIISFVSGCQTLTTQDGSTIRVAQSQFFQEEFAVAYGDVVIKEKQTEEGWKKVDLYLSSLWKGADPSLKPYASFYGTRVRGEWYYGRRDPENPDRITLFQREMKRLHQNEKGDSGGGGW